MGSNLRGGKAGASLRDPRLHCELLNVSLDPFQIPDEADRKTDDKKIVKMILLSINPSV